MGKRKKQPTLTARVVLGWMIMLVICSMTIAIISYRIYRNQLLDARAEVAESVAVAMALRIDGDKFSDIMRTLEKNDYWYEVKEYADNIAVVFNTAFIYILDKSYDDEVLYFAEGAPGDAPFDLGMGEAVDVYAEEMFETIATGLSSITEPYASGDYGDMVSGFAAITDKSGSVVGVVGVDFYYEDVEAKTNAFGLTMVGVVVGFMIFAYYVMTYLGTKLAGNPLTELDNSARQLSLGDMNIDVKVHSKSEIGRLADSFRAMIDGMKTQVSALEVVSTGDLTVHIDPRSDHDTMGHAIIKILDSLNEMFTEMAHSANQVSSGAKQISDSAQTLAQGASEQTHAVEQLSSSISQVSMQANENLKVAKRATELADTIKSDAGTGSAQMDKMTSAVKDISDASVSISRVIKVIDDIAFQTNILALNAAVEAARAGQHGKGFAVVAEEVRNLAAKSAEAAKDTSSLISNSMEKAQLGAAIAEETAVSLDRIISGINECVVLVQSMASSFETQINTMTQINHGVEQVSHVVQQNSATAEESAAASQQMSAQSVMLHQMIDRFKIKDNRNLPN